MKKTEVIRLQVTNFKEIKGKKVENKRIDKDILDTY